LIASEWHILQRGRTYLQVETCADYHGERSICQFCFLPNCRSYWRSRLCYSVVLCCLFVRLSVTLSICDVCIVAYGVS